LRRRGRDDIRRWNALKVWAEFLKTFFPWKKADQKAGKSVDEAVVDYEIPVK
jgi:hypothetical protein